MWHAARRMLARVNRGAVLLVCLVAVLSGQALVDVAAARPASRLALAPLSGPAGTKVLVRGSGFRPHGAGVVVLGGRRVASFRATARGRFHVGFVVPAGPGGRLRLTVQRVVRGRHGAVRRLSWTSARFRVVTGGSPGRALVGAPAGSSNGSPVRAGAGSTGASGGVGSTGVGVGATTVPPTAGSAGATGGSIGGSTSSLGSGGSKVAESPKVSIGPKAPEAPKTSESPKAPEAPKVPESPKGATGSRWIPPQHLTWYWQLQGTVNNSEPVAAYDIDGFENTAAEVATLHGQDKHAICYIDVGTAEEFRPDDASFPASVQGDTNGWPGEKWLDIRALSTLEPIMTARFRMCKEKGFDAVEPDNEDGYSNSTGFPLTAAQQLVYDEWVANEVHSLGMAVFQKNDTEQVGELEPFYDGVIDEQCNEYSECDTLQPYLSAGKPVLDAEYSSFSCTADQAAGIMGARFDLELDGTMFEPCS
jgi:hypothetical protein